MDSWNDAPLCGAGCSGIPGLVNREGLGLIGASGELAAGSLVDHVAGPLDPLVDPTFVLMDEILGLSRVSPLTASLTWSKVPIGASFRRLAPQSGHVPIVHHRRRFGQGPAQYPCRTRQSGIGVPAVGSEVGCRRQEVA